MTGLAQVILTDKELGRIRQWYIAHLLAEENTQLDDEIDARLAVFQQGTRCPIPTKQG